MKAIVTLRFPRNSLHDPKNKKIGKCPASHAIYHPEILCTDVTGEHHSYLETGLTITEIEQKAKEKYPDAHHITRIEVVNS